MGHSQHDSIRFNLAGEYNKSRMDGGTKLTLDEYCNLVRAFGQMAITLDGGMPPELKLTPLTVDEEIDLAFTRFGIESAI
jgi:hypothetical protein